MLYFDYNYMNLNLGFKTQIFLQLIVIHDPPQKHADKVQVVNKG